MSARRILPFVLLAACGSDPEPAITGTQGLKVDLVSPADPGNENNRICYNTNGGCTGAPITSATINITAIGVDGETDTTFNNDVQVYANYLGTLTPYLCDPHSESVCSALATAHMQSGVAMGIAVPLPAVFGPTTLWVDDGAPTHGATCMTDGDCTVAGQTCQPFGTANACMATPTYATGSSPTLWYRDPFVVDSRKPADETALNAMEVSPLETKQITVNESRYGATGRLVVTSVFAQGYTVADVQCADANGTPPCTAQDYDNLEVFSFSAAKDGIGCFLVQGQSIDGFAGGVSSFDGLTELGFPQSFVDHGQGGDCSKIDVNAARIPTPIAFDPSWFTDIIQFKRKESAAIEVDGAVLCNLDADYDGFNQWKLDPFGVGGDCSKNDNVINVVSAGVVQAADTPTLTALAGKKIPRVVGMLRSLNIGSFHVWLIYPRGDADVQLQ